MGYRARLGGTRRFRPERSEGADITADRIEADGIGTGRIGQGRVGTHGTGIGAPVAQYAPAGLVERVVVTLSGVRQPIVAILLAISFMTVISGKPVDGFLLALVATALAWDAGLRSAQERAAGLPVRADGFSGGTGSRDMVGEVQQRSAWTLRTARPPARIMALSIGAASICSLIFGSFTRYSWPATAGVVGVGASVVIVGWGGPTRRRAIPGKFPRSAAATWGTLLIAAGTWELIALLGQPNIETGSYAHPTISTLTDPLLASPLGRAVALFGWIGLGVFLVER